MSPGSFDQENLANALFQFAQNAGGIRMPETREREIAKEIPYDQVEVKKCSGLFDFVLAKDEYGEYVRVRFGFNEGSHYVSPPVLFRDRRGAMVTVANKYADYFTTTEINRIRQGLQFQLGVAKEQLQATQEIIPQAESLTRQFQAELDRIEADFAREEGWTEAEKKEREGLEAQRIKIRQQIERLTPEFLEAEASQRANRVTTLESLLSQSPEVPVPDVGRANPKEELFHIFTSSSGIVREIQITERISSVKENYLEIGESDIQQPGQGLMEFFAQHIKIPKPIPLIVPTMFLFDDLFAEDNIRRKVEERGGIYRVISYSSGTCRHQGRATCIIWPNRSVEVAENG